MPSSEIATLVDGYQQADQPLSNEAHFVVFDAWAASFNVQNYKTFIHRKAVYEQMHNRKIMLAGIQESRGKFTGIKQQPHYFSVTSASDEDGHGCE
eukprot:7730954-Karenia_brevis.AAC.1